MKAHKFFRSKYASYHIIILLMVLAIFAISISVCASEQEDKSRWDIRIRTESLEKLLLEPEKVHADPDDFWSLDEAYSTVLMWHETNNIPLEFRDYYTKWQKFLNERISIERSKRQSDSAFLLLQKILVSNEVFQTRGVQLLEDFTPRNDLKFETNVYITGRILPYAFMTNGKIVIDILSPHFKNDHNIIFNSITHECFHISYGYNRYLRSESPLENSFIYNTMLDGLQNEGIATYLGYLANDFFPANEIEDYQMFESMDVVRAKINSINELFTMADSLESDSLRKLAWQIGVVNRGYYIAGAFMAKSIDEMLGRQALINTITAGPLSFVDTYNSIVNKDLEVRDFQTSEVMIPISRLKSAAIDMDYEGFNKSLVDLANSKNDLMDKHRKELERLGYGLILEKKYEWAIKVFEADTLLFSNHPNPYDCLAEAYLKSGNTSMAIKYYQVALHKDPSFSNARKMLDSIKYGKAY